VKKAPEVSANNTPERGRFSRGKKARAVLRLLRGEGLDKLSRELGVTAASLADWRDRFLVGGQSNLKSRNWSGSTTHALEPQRLSLPESRE